MDDLLERVTTQDIGDTLFKFFVTETIEGGEGTLEGAVRVLERAEKTSMRCSKPSSVPNDAPANSAITRHTTVAPRAHTFGSGGVPTATAAYIALTGRSPRRVRLTVPAAAARCGWPEVLAFPTSPTSFE